MISLFNPDPKLIDFDLLNPENTDLVDFKQRYKSSPVSRAKRLGFLRNIIVAISNINSTKIIPILLKIYLTEKNNMIRNLIIWSLQKFPLPQVEEKLQIFVDENPHEDLFKSIILDLINRQGINSGK